MDLGSLHRKAGGYAKRSRELIYGKCAHNEELFWLLADKLKIPELYPAKSETNPLNI